MVVAELSGVVEDEVVGNVFDGCFFEISKPHHRDVFEVFAPTIFLEQSKGVVLAAALAVGGDEVKRLLLERLGQTDHARSELLAAYSSTPNDEEGHFTFEVGGRFQFRTGPVSSPFNVLGGAFDFAVVLLACKNGKAEQGGVTRRCI